MKSLTHRNWCCTKSTSPGLCRAPNGFRTTRARGAKASRGFFGFVSAMHVA